MFMLDIASCNRISMRAIVTHITTLQLKAIVTYIATFFEGNSDLYKNIVIRAILTYIRTLS